MNSIEPELPNINCSFPSPAEDHMGLGLDLHQHLVKHPAATFFARASGESMIEAGILSGDLLIVDRSITPQNNSIVVVVLNGSLSVKQLKIIQGQSYLYPANKKYAPLAIAQLEQQSGFEFWGVVTHAIHDLRPS